MGVTVADESTDLQPQVMLKEGVRVLEADVYRSQWHGQPVVVKDYSRYKQHPLGFVARWMVRHEAKMLRLLSGWGHAPAFVTVIGGLALVMQFVPGEPLGEVETVNTMLFMRLRKVLDEMHAAGIAHNDLRRTNILICEDGRPVLVDFTSAWRFPRWLRGNPISKQMLSGDFGNFLKMRQRMLGIKPSPEEVAASAEAPWVSCLRRGWRRLYAPFRHKGKS